MTSALTLNVTKTDLGDTSNFTTPHGLSVDAAVQDLVTLGFSPLPVAPAQDPHKYPAKDKSGKVIYQNDGVTPKPLFSGKNPSYLDSNGEPRTVAHSRYRGKLPTTAELNEWFQNESVGVGTNGGAWLDFDLKNFTSPDHLDSAVAPILERAQWVERTQSGGYRVAVAPEQKPDFTNFGVGDVAHAGELLNGGGFVVLAPTVGEKGEYKRLKFGPPLAVATVEELGIRPSRATKATPTLEPPTPTPPPETPRPVALSGALMGEVIPLAKLLSKKVAAILSGQFGEDRSEDLVKVARECYGWENLARSEGVSVSPADSIVATVAESAGLADRLDRILQGVNREACEPALSNAPGKSRGDCIKILEGMAGKQRSVNSNDIEIQDEDTAGLLSFRELYEGQNYVNIRGEFYQFTGNKEDGFYYERKESSVERNRISNLLKRCVKIVVTRKSTIISRPYSTKQKIDDAYAWCLCQVNVVLDSEINPPGINLKNGVLQFSYNDEPEVRLVDHSPEIIYTYKPEVEYKPDCDRTAAQKLLEVLEDKYRTATIRTLSAALHLDLVRQKKGRIVRAMFFNGGGNNGKDSLREAITQIFSRSGVTSIGLKDFQLYDEGKKFGVAQLLGSRLNISSENKASLNIDELQSLKQAGSGDPLICEKKGVDGEEFIPSCVLVFSTNDTTVNLTASLEAISSRYVVVPFKKTYTDNPTKPNELKADPRFKYDPEWVRSDVCPGLLNIMVEEFKAIFEEGIDYSPFAEAMEKNRVDANHLCRFGIDSGLVEDADGWVSNQDLEVKLRIWYEAEGVLKIDDSGREYWAEDVRAGDPWVRGTPQYKKRFSRIFPGITSQKKSDVRGIRGLRFASPAEEPLRKVETYSDYLAVVKLLGKAEIDRAWPYLSPEERDRITALAPATTDPEPLAESDMQAEIAILIEAAESGEVEAMEHFIGLPEMHKKQIWESTPPEVIPKVKELVSTCRSQIQEVKS